jgi:hypothetical protein
VGYTGRDEQGYVKNQKSEVGNDSCVDRNHAPLAVLALAAVFREVRDECGTSRVQK